MKSFFLGLLMIAAVAPAYSQQKGTTSRPLSFGSTEKFVSKKLSETRTINIYLPEGYNIKDTVQYPVIYIPDGGQEEDFFHLAGLVRYNTQPWIARFPRSIVVGIENTNRRRDFTFAVPDLDFVSKMGFKKEQFASYGGSAKYIAFLEQELQPYISRKYKGSGTRTLIGESLAGLLATEILMKHTNMFDNYIIIAPSLWWGSESLLKTGTIIPVPPGKEIKVYVGAAKKEEEETMYRDAVALSDLCKAQAHLKVYFDYMPDELHSTLIHQSVYNAFKLFYPKTAMQQ